MTTIQLMLIGVFGFLMGIILGSFTKAFSDRVIANQSIRGRSRCPKCKKTLKWYDLFPLFSYILLKGKCRYCKRKIDPANFLTELCIGVSVALVFIASTPSNLEPLFNLNLQTFIFISNLVFKTFVIVILATIFLIDLKTGLIPNRVMYPAVVIVALFLLVLNSIKSWVFYRELLNSPLGQYLLPPQSSYFSNQLLRIWEPAFSALLAGLAVASFFALLIILTRGKGMGWGDVKFAFFLGLALGFPNIAIGIFLAFVSGAVFSLALISIRQKSFGQTIPFGPFLSLGGFVALLWGTQIINWYLESFHF